MYAGKYPRLFLKRKSKLNKIKREYFAEDRIIKRHTVLSVKLGWLLREYEKGQCWPAWCFPFFSWVTMDDDGAALHPAAHHQAAKQLPSS